MWKIKGGQELNLRYSAFFWRAWRGLSDECREVGPG